MSTTRPSPRQLDDNIQRELIRSVYASAPAHRGCFSYHIRRYTPPLEWAFLYGVKPYSHINMSLMIGLITAFYAGLIISFSALALEIGYPHRIIVFICITTGAMGVYQIRRLANIYREHSALISTLQPLESAPTTRKQMG